MDLTVENLLLIQDFRSDDLRRRFNCSVKNARGSESRRALLSEEGEEASDRSEATFVSNRDLLQIFLTRL